MENTGQNFANHTRWHPPFHFVLLPMLFLNFIWSAVRVWRMPGWDSAEGLMLAVALMMTGVFARANAIAVQDRLIRLEEHLRYRRLLPDSIAQQAIDKLGLRQIIALRFASDAELPGLVNKVLAGSPSQPADIKKAVQNWRGDYARV